MKWPQVADEFHTMGMVAKGFNLARFGDGEMKMAQGFGYAREPGSRQLANELMRTLRMPRRRCLVGIPTYDPAGPKFEGWMRHQERFLSLLQPSVPYFSAFISRPDSAPWIRCKDYADLVESVWRGKFAAVLCEHEGSTLKLVGLRAAKVRHIECPRHEAYARIDFFEERIVRLKPDVVIMSAGPTATCLANRLAEHDIHALDLGSAGGWLHRLLKA